MDDYDYYIDHDDFDYGPETDLEPVKACPVCGSTDMDSSESCDQCHGTGLIHDMQGDGAWAMSMSFYCDQCSGYGYIYDCENGHKFYGDGEIIEQKAGAA